jgi:hypothetical protein
MTITRRNFIAAAAIAAAPRLRAAAVDPWYRRTYRWGQTNITDPSALFADKC